MLKKAQVTVILRDLREKRDRLDDMIGELEEVYGVERRELDIEDQFLGLQREVREVEEKGNGSPRKEFVRKEFVLSHDLASFLKPGKAYRAQDLVNEIKRDTGLDVHMQSVAAQLSTYNKKGIAKRVDKGVYVKGGE